MLKMTSNHIRKAFLKVAGGSAISALLFALLLIYASRQLSIQNLGYFLIAYSSALLMTDFFDFGTGAREILNAHTIDHKICISNLRNLAKARVLISVTCWVVGVVIAIQFGQQFLFSSAILMALMFSLRILLQTELRVQKKYSSLSFVQILERVIALILFVAFDPYSATQLSLIFSISNALVLVIFRWRPQFGFSSRDIFLKYRDSFTLGLSSVATDLMLLDLFLISIILSSEVSGEFGLINRILTPIPILFATLSTIVLREFNFQDMKVEQFNLKFLQIKKIILLLGVVFVSLMIILGKFIISVSLGPDYIYLYKLLILVAASSVIAGLLQFYYSVQLTRGRLTFVTIVTLTYSSVYLLIMPFVLIPLQKYGPPLLQIFLSLLILIVCRHRFRIK